MCVSGFGWWREVLLTVCRWWSLARWEWHAASLIISSFRNAKNRTNRPQADETLLDFSSSFYDSRLHEHKLHKEKIAVFILKKQKQTVCSQQRNICTKMAAHWRTEVWIFFCVLPHSVSQKQTAGFGCTTTPEALALPRFTSFLRFQPPLCRSSSVFSQSHNSKYRERPSGRPTMTPEPAVCDSPAVSLGIYRHLKNNQCSGACDCNVHVWFQDIWFL